jgi:hypothetical protein
MLPAPGDGEAVPGQAQRVAPRDISPVGHFEVLWRGARCGSRRGNGRLKPDVVSVEEAVIGGDFVSVD